MARQATYIQNDENIDYVPSSNVASGDVAVIGGRVGVAKAPILAGILGAISLEGVYDFVKSPTISGYGAKGIFWFWDPIALIATTVDSGNTPIGYSVADCADADITVRVRLGEFKPSVAVQIAISASGAINPRASSDSVITKAGIAALTLAAPIAGVDDGKVIRVTSATAFAHTITATGLLQTGSASANVATFAAFAGAGLTLKAYQGKWQVISSNGITFS